MDSINAYSSQFHQSDELDQGIVTPIIGKDFKLFIDGRARQFGRTISVEFGEGFNTSKPVSVKNLLELL